MEQLDKNRSRNSPRERDFATVSQRGRKLLFSFLNMVRIDKNNFVNLGILSAIDYETREVVFRNNERMCVDDDYWPNLMHRIELLIMLEKSSMKFEDLSCTACGRNLSTIELNEGKLIVQDVMELKHKICPKRRG